MAIFKLDKDTLEWVNVGNSTDNLVERIEEEIEIESVKGLEEAGITSPTDEL